MSEEERIDALEARVKDIYGNEKLVEEMLKMLEQRQLVLMEDTCNVRHVPFKKLHPDAVAPKYYSDGAVAFDLHPLITDKVNADGEVVKVDTIEVEPHSQKIIPTGLAFSVPEGFELRISPRSGQSAKQQISIRNSPGIIDSDYRGEIMVIFVNNKDTVHVITKDQRVCQVKLSKAYRADFEEVDELDETKRGEGRFGSTGNI